MTAHGRWAPLTLRRLLPLVFLLALVLRLAAIFDLAELPTAQVLLMDAERYDRMATELLDHGWLPPAAFDQAPGYPYFLAAVYSLAGRSYLAVRLLQALLDSLSVVLVAWVAARGFGLGAALATGLLAAFYGPLVFHTALLLKPTLTIFLTAAFLALWVVSQSAGERRWRSSIAALAAGLCLGASALLRENALLLIPLAMLASVTMPLAPPPAIQRRWAAAGLIAAGAVLALLPSAAINHQRSGEWLLTSWQGGMNFLIGNARGATGTYSPLSPNSQDPAQERADARRLAATVLSDRRAAEGLPPVTPEELSPDRLSTLLWAEARRQIVEDPGAWLRLMGRKLWLFWNRYEIPDAEGYDLYRQRSPALRVATVDFGLLAPLALAGLAIGLTRRERRPAALALGGFAAGVCLSVVLFFVFARYRLPVVVFLLPLAGYALAAVPRAARQRDLGALAAGGCALVLAAVAAWWPAFSSAERHDHEAILRYNLASAGLERASGLYERAVTERARGDELPGSRRPATAAREGERALEQALAELDAVLDTMPDLTTARLSRGVAYLRLGSFRALRSDGAGARTAYALAARDLELAGALARRRGESEIERQVDELLEVLERNRALVGPPAK